MYRVRQEELPFVGSSHEFIGAELGERCGNVHSRAPVSTGDGEEHRRNLTDHVPSLPPMALHHR